MTAFDPGTSQEFLAALTRVDLGEADGIVTTSGEVAQWAARRGYQIEAAMQGKVLVYEIKSGIDSVFEDG